jgi:hypothetical protein
MAIFQKLGRKTTIFLATAALCGLLPLTVAAEVISKMLSTGDEKRVDNLVDVWMTAHTGAAGKPVTNGYRNKRFELLHTNDIKQGGFSVVFTAGEADAAQAFGVYSGEYIDHWVPGEDFKTSVPDR